MLIDTRNFDEILDNVRRVGLLVTLWGEILTGNVEIVYGHIK